VLALGGADAVVLADAATFLACAALLATGPCLPVPPRAEASRLLADWAEGIALIKASPVLRRVLGATACTAIAQGGFVVLFVLFAVRDLGVGEAEIGLLRGVQAVGAVAGGLLLGALAHRAQPRRLLATALATFGLLTLVIWNAPSVTTTLGWYVALFIAVGIPGVVAVSVTVSLMQQHAGGAAAGRVLGTYAAVFGAMQACGMLIAGLVGTDAGLTIALQVQGVLHLLAAVLALRIPATSEPRHR
jgi:predicted MFS family arabinose efflux permease